MWLSDLKVVLPDRVLERGSVRLEGGCIAEIIEGPHPLGENLSGLALLPGLVDVHGDMLERELQPRPGTTLPSQMAIHETDKRLIGNGITTAYAALSFEGGPGLRSNETVLSVLRDIQLHRKHCHADWKIHVRYEMKNTAVEPLIAELLEAGEVDFLSLMDHSPGQGQFRDLENFIKYYAAYYGSSREHVEQMLEGYDHQSIRQAWERAHHLTRTADRQGITVASHDDDTPEKVDFVRGLQATLSEFPVTLEAAQHAKQQGMGVIMGAPNVLRGKSHSGNLSAMEAIGHGLVDMLASDYHPPAMLAAALKLFHQGHLSLPEAVRLVTLNPARACGLTDRGSLEVGKQADLVVVDLQGTGQVKEVFVQGEKVWMSRTRRVLQNAL